VNEDDPGLQQLVAAVLDGTPVDWASAEAGAPNHAARRVISELRVIAGIADLHGRASHAGPDVDDAASAPPETWGPLRLIERVGEGAYGEVFRASDTRLDREIALKLLRRQDPDRSPDTSTVIDEGRLLAQVRHPNVVTVHGADRFGGRVGLWMEFIHGRTLEQVVCEEGPLDAPEATRIAIDLCRALAAVHRAGLVHRDITARNVMRDTDGRTVLMDFGTGLDRASAADGSARGLAGTPLYIAPELLDGQEASAQSDVYAVGVLLYHLLTGAYPVQGRNVREIRGQHARGERTTLHDRRPDLPGALVSIVERALAIRPEDRFASAEAMETALTQSLPGTPTVRDRPGARAPRRAAAVAVGVFLLLGVGAAWMSRATWTSPAPVIAVLPFENPSADPDSELVVDGLTNELIDRLSEIEGLSVTSRASSFALRNTSLALAEVGEQLGADVVLEGSMLRSGDRLRVNARLARVADDRTLWAKNFDSAAEDVFAIQDEIALAIVNELRLTLGRGQRRYQTSPDVYYQFLRARGLQARRNPVNSAQAADLFARVVASDPSYAPAWAGLSSALANIPRTGPSLPPPDPRMEAAALRALQLDPLLAEAHAAMGVLYSSHRDWANAEGSFRKAIELNPGLTTTHTEFVLSVLLPMARWDESLEILAGAREADPLSLDVRRIQALVDVDSGRYDEAIENSRWVLARDPQFPYASVWLGRALTLSGRTDEALPIVEKGDASYLGYLYAVTGRRAEAEALAAGLADTPIRQMLIHGGLGDRDRAFEALERAAVSNWWMAATWSLRPEMAVLRGDPRLVAIRERLGLPTP
jgi:serine/threonine-protein kinase